MRCMRTNFGIFLTSFLIISAAGFGGGLIRGIEGALTADRVAISLGIAAAGAAFIAIVARLFLIRR